MVYVRVAVSISFLHRAILFVPMTKEMYFELGLQLESHHVVLLREGCLHPWYKAIFLSRAVPITDATYAWPISLRFAQGLAW